MHVIETERLLLRRQAATDAPFLLELMNDPDWIRYIGDRGVRTLEEARAYIRDGAVAMYEQHGFGLYLVETKTDGVPVGICGLLRRDDLDDVDLGFALARAHRGRGYAREAAEATLAYARDVVGLRRVAALVAPGNTASIRLLHDLGFTFDRVCERPNGPAVHLMILELRDPDATSPGSVR